MGKIRHLAIRTDNPKELAQFYIDTFGLQVEQPLTSLPGKGSWVFLTDGYMRLALVDPGIKDSKNGIHHFAVMMDEAEHKAILKKLKAQGIEPQDCNNPYLEDRVEDIDGNPIDLSSAGLRLR